MVHILDLVKEQSAKTCENVYLLLCVNKYTSINIHRLIRVVPNFLVVLQTVLDTVDRDPDRDTAARMYEPSQ